MKSFKKIAQHRVTPKLADLPRMLIAVTFSLDVQFPFAIWEDDLSN
jgi:hypothetical protein